MSGTSGSSRPGASERTAGPGAGPPARTAAVVREERPGDAAAIRAVTDAAFGQPQEGQLVDLLRRRGAITLSLVATIDGRVVGHVLYSPARVAAVGGGHAIDGAALGPMAVEPPHQRRGIGTALVAEGTRRLRERSCPFVAVLGHPQYYPRFGFVPAAGYGLRCRWEVPDDVFMVLPLEPGALEAGSCRPARLVEYRAEFALVD